MSIRNITRKILSAQLALSCIVAVASANEADPSSSVDASGVDVPHEEGSHDHGSDRVYDEILVTASPHARRQFDVIQGSTILTGDALQERIRATIGETLAQEPGISSSYFAPGASRPVIRGLDGPRVRVLLNGIGTIDASTTSPDHAVSAEPLLAERIEVVRGAGTLLYGSAAIGGVVNIDDGRIPSAIPENGFKGALVGLYGTAAEEKATGAALTAGHGHFTIHAEGFFRDTNDLDVPGYAKSGVLRALEQATDPGDFDPGPYGTVPNTNLENKGGVIGGSTVWDWGYFGVAYGLYDSNYGLPDVGGTHEHDDGDPGGGGEQVRIDLRQQRVDFGGELDLEWLAFESTRLRVGYGDYDHQELEQGAVATLFENEGWEGRLDLVQRPLGDLHGSVGFQFGVRDFAAIGDESFTPPSKTRSYALFAVEEYPIGPVTLEAGLRYEHTSVEAPPLDLMRKFDTVSFSLGGGWSLGEDYLLGLSLSRTERPPTAEELFSDGPHLATGGYEIGNPLFDEEAGLTIEATARKRHGRFTGNINLYYTWFDEFIFQEYTGDVIDDLPVRQYIQDDTEFLGGEFVMDYEAIQHQWFTGILDLGLDYIYAREKDNGEPLPRIPPFSVWGGIGATSERVDARFEARYVAAQNRVAELELPTDDYWMLNIRLAWRPIPERADLSLVIDMLNLLDQDARNHVSVLKDVLPLPGRDFRFSMRVDF